jgi:hypothetical protein
MNSPTLRKRLLGFVSKSDCAGPRRVYAEGPISTSSASARFQYGRNQTRETERSKAVRSAPRPGRVLAALRRLGTPALRTRDFFLGRDFSTYSLDIVFWVLTEPVE